MKYCFADGCRIVHKHDNKTRECIRNNLLCTVYVQKENYRNKEGSRSLGRGGHNDVLASRRSLPHRVAQDPSNKTARFLVTEQGVPIGTQQAYINKPGRLGAPMSTNPINVLLHGGNHPWSSGLSGRSTTMYAPHGARRSA